MKKIVIRKNFVKVAIVSLIFSVLLFSNFFIMVNAKEDIPTQTIETNKSSNVVSTTYEGAYEKILFENFTDCNCPPYDEVHSRWWDNTSSSSCTWNLTEKKVYSEPYAVTVGRGNCIDPLIRNECLISPSLDFSGYIDKKISMTFAFCGNWYVSCKENFCDFNINISTDGGITWEAVWNETSIPESIWNDIEYMSVAELTKPIDLTRFGGNNSVLICFQFLSRSTELFYKQQFFLDEIVVSVESDKILTCDAGGTYVWSYRSQLFDLAPDGVRFHGSVNGAPWRECEFFWDFGDYNTSNVTMSIPYAIHMYDSYGTYNVYLRVTDRASGIFTNDTATVIITPGGENDIKISMNPNSIGVKADIKNTNEEKHNATYINWTIAAEGPFRLLHPKMLGEGIIENLKPGDPPQKLPCNKKKFFIYFGPIVITITAIPSNMPPAYAQYRAFKFGPFIIGADRVGI